MIKLIEKLVQYSTIPAINLVLLVAFVAGLALFCHECDLDKKGKRSHVVLMHIWAAIWVTAITLLIMNIMIHFIAGSADSFVPWQIVGVSSALLAFVSVEVLYVLIVYTKPQCRAYLRTNTSWQDISSQKAKRITWRKVWLLILIISLIGSIVVPLIGSNI